MELFIYIKIDLALNNLQWLMCHKTKSKPNQIREKKFSAIKKLDDSFV